MRVLIDERAGGTSLGAGPNPPAPNKRGAAARRAAAPIVTCSGLGLDFLHRGVHATVLRRPGRRACGNSGSDLFVGLRGELGVDRRAVDLRLRVQLLDVRVELGPGLPRGDQAVPRLVARVPHGVPQPLRIDDDLRAGWQRDARLGGRVVLVLTQHHDRVRVVGEVEEAAHDPAGALGVETVVVVAVQVVDGLGVGVRLQLDDPAAADVGAGLLSPGGQPRRLVDVRRHPDAVLVGLRRGVVPEAVAFHVAVRAGEWSEAGVAGRLPVDVFDVHPLGWILWLVVEVEDDVAGLLEGRQLDVAHGAQSALSGVGHWKLGEPITHVSAGPGATRRRYPAGTRCCARADAYRQIAAAAATLRLSAAP